MSESLTGNKPWNTGKSRSESHKQHMSRVISEKMQGSEPQVFGEMQLVPETGHKVRSSWEADFDVALHESNVQYEYEPSRFDLGNRSYLPDFICGESIVVEVKGYVLDGSVEKGRKFMEQYPEYTYVVVGGDTSHKIPCDKHFEWDEDNLQEVTDWLEDAIETTGESVSISDQ